MFSSRNEEPADGAIAASYSPEFGMLPGSSVISVRDKLASQL
jgi:hypothetical protein